MTETRSQNFTAIRSPWRKLRARIYFVSKHFGWECLNVQPSCCLDVVVYVLDSVFWRHIPLEIEFKSRAQTQAATHSGITHEC